MERVCKALLERVAWVILKVGQGNALARRQRVMASHEHVRAGDKQRRKCEMRFVKGAGQNLLICGGKVQDANVGFEVAHVIDNLAGTRFAQRKVVGAALVFVGQAHERLDAKRVMLGANG